MSGPTQPEEKLFDKGTWGFDGTVWRKLNLTWGYNAELADQVVNGDSAVGDIRLQQTTVPAGEVWVVTGSSVYASYAETRHYIRKWNAFNDQIVYDLGALVAGVYSCTLPVQYTLAAGSYIYHIFVAAPLHSVLVGNIWGYKMKVTM